MAAVGGIGLITLQAGHAATLSNTPPVDVNLPGAQACYGIGAGPVVDPCQTPPAASSQSFDYTDVGGADYGTASGNVAILGGDDPSVSATAVAKGAVHADAWGYLWYAFEITAPANIDQVPILLMGTDSVTGSTDTDEGGAASTAQVLVCSTAFTPQQDPVTDSICSTPVFFTSDLTNINEDLELTPGDIYEVELYAEGSAHGEATDAPPFIGTASVDPTLSVDPSVAGPGYSIAYGPGLFPPTAAPEPASLAVLCPALIGLGLLRRPKPSVA